MTLVLFIIILGILIFVHELGHFLVAKRSGMRVDEFALGFPPKLFSWKRGETTYALNLIPFGGYVKIHGENPNESGDEGPDASRSFANKNRGLQTLVLVAGVTGNFVFAWLILSLGFMTGLPAATESYPNATVTDEKVFVAGVLPESPASLAGLVAGDTIVGISYGDTDISIPTMDEVKNVIGSAELGDAVSIEYLRGSETEEVNIVPAIGVIDGAPGIGIEMASVGNIKLPFFSAIYEGGKLTYQLTIAVIVGLVSFFADVFTLQADLSGVMGPVGIAGIVGDASAMGFGYLISITAIISIHLAVINLAPFPALDGGRIMFVAIEAVVRRRISPKIQNYANGLGFLLLMLLMVVVTYRDILKLF